MKEFIITNEMKERVLDFAKKAHGDQKRKYTGEPYWTHVKEVGDIVSGLKDQGYFNNGPESVKIKDCMICAAYLHDTVEDTEVTLIDIEEFLSEELKISNRVCRIILTMVEDLTDISKPEDGNREARKQIDREHTLNGLSASCTVKLADLISNTSSIVEYDKKFAVIYIQEKDLFLQGLGKKYKSIDWDLYLKACYIVYKSLIELGLRIPA